MIKNAFFILLSLLLSALLPYSSLAQGSTSLPSAQTNKIKLQKSAYKLNIVYFLGNDAEAVPDYERRISELMIYAQQFYGREMKKNGFGARSFGLDMQSPTRINFIKYTAKNPKSHYPYSNGGGGRALKELEQFFKENPDKRKSQHTLVIMPTWNDDVNGPKNPGGVPFYGMGRYCFALDYPDFDIKHLGQKTREGALLTKWYGGLVHELGHGLNLPHNHETKTEQQKYGTALMGAGNYTFGSKPTFLTPASCAILDACEVFETSDKIKYYAEKPSIELKNISISFTDKQILISGNYTSPSLVKSLIVYVQDAPYAVNRDYDSLSFTQKLNQKSKKFSFKINRDELIGLSKNEFRVSLRFIFQNGLFIQKNYVFYKDNLKDYKE